MDATATKTDRIQALTETFRVSRTDAERRMYWLLERSGSPRYAWGPYTLAEAIDEKGTLHVIVRGAGLANGQAMSAGEIQAAIQSYRIWPVEPDVQTIA